MTGLSLTPIGLRAANAFVGQEHRHHPPTTGHKFSVAVASEDGVHGVAIAGRPVNRHLDDGLHLEVLRVCTDGTPNACSMLYGAIARAAIALGYSRHNVLTYTLADEPGTSLHAAGWVRDRVTKAEPWGRRTRPRDERPIVAKMRWRAAA